MALEGLGSTQAVGEVQDLYVSLAEVLHAATDMLNNIVDIAAQVVNFVHSCAFV